ncbi:MAG: tol-pal system protein YbgF [Lentisphaeria bacterium]|nr:tol-pal system protein YbgF [Candidatus Neomarinimicrobiota bacterium]MCF7841715.1 tol-pal system protein YbgF [Lentisphaeria bacterium]
MNRHWTITLTLTLALGLTTLFFSGCSSTKPAEPDPIQQELLTQLKSLGGEIGKLQATQDELLEMRQNLTQMDSQLVIYQNTLAEKEKDSKAKDSEILELRGNIDILSSEIQSLRVVVDTLRMAKDSLDFRLQRLTEEILPKLEQKTVVVQKEAQADSAQTAEMPAQDTPDKTKPAEAGAAPSEPAKPVKTTLTAREYRRQYNAALNKYFQRDYVSAIKLFNELINLWPDGTYADNCQYWIGECYYSLENYQQAIEEFSKVSAFPENNKADHALFKIGMCYLQLGNKTEAETLFHQVMDKYPESDMIPRVKEYFAGKKM